MDWRWAGPPLDTRPLFPLERGEFVALLRNLEASDWQRPTVCPGWSVRDVVAHVVHDYIRKLSRARDRQAGPGPWPGEDLPGFLHRVNQEFVDVARSWSPAVLVDLIGHLGPQLDQFWASLDLNRAGEPVSWAAPGVPAPVWLDVAREYTEYWVHQQQVRDAVGRPGAADERLTAPVTDTFLRAVPHALRHLSAAPGTCLHIQVTGPGRRQLDDPPAGLRLGGGPGLARSARRLRSSSSPPIACGGWRPGASPWRRRGTRPPSPAIRPSDRQR